MKVVMKIVLQTDSQMRSWKYKQTNKKAKKRKIAFKNANATERRHVFLRETEQFLALVNLPSDDSLPFVTFVLPQKTGKKDETPDRRLIYIYGHTTAKNSVT